MVRTRLLTLLLALGLVTAACSPSDTIDTTTAGPSTTTSSVVPTTTTGPAPPTTTTTTTTLQPRPTATLPTFDDDGEAIEDDPAVTIGTLDNGLTYYVRSNNRPGGNAELRLAVRAGSVQEEDDQRGVAHYLEHMLFNGTEKYPANELIDVLGLFGSEFGPDINAYTSYEETVYELALPLGDGDLLETGLDVLREWAAFALIDPEEVDLERGVLLEEWRLRSQSYTGRYFDGVTDVLLAGTPFADRSPLADEPLLDVTTPETLRRFYEDWYRPDNMAIVAVGDFDVNSVVAQIQELFGDLPPRGGEEPPVITTEPATEPQFFILADPENRQSFVELNYPVPAEPGATIGDRRASLAERVAWTALVTRLGDDALRGVTPFFAASGAANPLVRSQDSPGVAAFAEPEELEATAEWLLREIERVQVHGFSVQEFDRAVEQFIADADTDIERAATVQDFDYADQYVENFLGGTEIPETAAGAELDKRLLDEMTIDQVVDTFRVAVQSTEPFIIVVAPDDSADVMPTADDLGAALDRVRTQTLERRQDQIVELDTLMDRPEPADVVGADVLSGSSIEVGTLENGARIVLLPTQIVEGLVSFGAFSPGGWSLLDEEDALEARLAPDIVALSGLGDIDQVSLERFLADKTAGVRPFVDETVEGLSGSAATEDLETLLQLVSLYMTSPNATEAARGIVLDNLRPFAEDPGSDPQLAINQRGLELRFDDPRFLAIPPLEDLETFDADRALEVYTERFADASDFVFVFSGDFEFPELLDLVRRYLGTLPASDTQETFANVRSERPSGVVTSTVESGAGVLGEIAFFWDVPVTLDRVTRMEARLLNLILRQRLTERIREELSATYSPRSFVTEIDEPEPSLEAFVTISADPTDLDRVRSEVLADVADLRANGPTELEMETAREQLFRESELFSNPLLIDLISYYLFRPDEDFAEFFDDGTVILAASRMDIRDLARLLFDPDDYIVVDLVPEDFEG